jgi:hypothetical protein
LASLARISALELPFLWKRACHSPPTSTQVGNAVEGNASAFHGGLRGRRWKVRAMGITLQ